MTTSSPPPRPKRLLITRPEEDAHPLAAELEDLGAEVLIEPMLTIRSVSGPTPDLAGVQALLVTSANGLRAFAARSPERDLAVFAVGDGSAAKARQAGFGRVESAGGGVPELAQLIGERLKPEGGPLLHVAGSRLAGDLGARLKNLGFDCRRAVLYDAEPSQDLGAEALAAFAGNGLDGVLFFSPRTARAFVTLVEKAEMMESCRVLAAFCLSPAVAAAAAALPWGKIVSADRPDQASMLTAVTSWMEQG